MINPKQFVAARGMLGLTQQDLALAAGVSPRTINKLEDGDEKTSYQTVLQVHRTLKSMGIEFLGTTGVNLTEEYKSYSGPDSGDRFYADLLASVKEIPSDIRVIFPTLEGFLRALGIVNLSNLERIEQLSKYANIKCLLSDAGHSSLHTSSIQCRSIPKHPLNPWSCVTYGEKTCLIIHAKNGEYGYVRVSSLDVNLNHVNEFETLWLTAPFHAPKLLRS